MDSIISDILFEIKNEAHKIPFTFIIYEGKFRLFFAMCSYGHEDYKDFDKFEEMLKYVSSHEYVAGFGEHICSDCFEENCI
ncbi:MAG: hypothetical protein FH761_19295 [Firmicutes bacterium]|nr:hypothetical protein [Bacillota bacterium]